MDSISGISLDQYAGLLVQMSDCGEDADACASIAESNGFSRADWESAKSGFTTKMSDPSDMGKTAIAFMPLYQAALDKKNNGKEPCSLEQYAFVHAEMAFRKDPADNTKKIDFKIVLNENNVTENQYNEWNSYWTPLVTTPGETHQKFSALIQENSDRINGIVRK
jgi:hypothetical protein